MITVDDLGRQLTVHFGDGTLAVSSGQARRADLSLGLVKIEQMIDADTPGAPVPASAKTAGSNVVLAFHNLEGLSVLEKALAKVREHLSVPDSGDRNTPAENLPVTGT